MAEAVPFTIRRATTGDAEIVTEFNLRLAWESESKRLDPSVLRVGVERALADDALCRYFLAVAGGETLGQVMHTYEWSDWRNGMIWWIQSVYVRPESRKLGVFSAIYRHIESLAQSDSNVVGLRLYVEDNNAVAQKTYEKMGMKNGGYHVLEKLW